MKRWGLFLAMLLTVSFVLLPGFSSADEIMTGRIFQHNVKLDHNVPSWPGMNLGAAISYASAGANKIWAGSVTIPPDVRTGAHHHGELESVIYVFI